MKCSEIQNLLSAYFDNELSAQLRAEVDEHIGKCAECSAELASFNNLSSMAAELEQPETPASVWIAVQQGLDDAKREGEAPAELAQRKKAQRELRPSEIRPPEIHDRKDRTRRSILQFAAAIAATVVAGFVGWTLWHGDHDHTEMAEAMEQIASDINSDKTTNLLLNKYGGSEVSYQDAITQVGFRPVASSGMPTGYSVESIQVLNMPCCKCTQTACQRPDKTRFFIYEHENEETGWFEHQNKRQSQCGGKTCEIVELSDQLAVTWQRDNRHVTMLGVRDEEEIELLVKQFEENS